MSSDAVEQLVAAVDGVLAVDVDELDDEELDAAIRELARQQARVAAAQARLLDRWDRTGVWTRDGSRSASAALSRATAVSASSAAVALRRARQLSSMPATFEALAAGRFSIDVVDVLARANRPAWRDRFVEHEATLVDQCAGLRYAEAVRLVEYWCQRVDAEAADDAAHRDRERAHLHASRTLDGAVVLNGVLDAVGGTIVVDELDRLERELLVADRRDGVVRSRSQRRAAALVVMAQRSSGAIGTPARPLFTVLVGDGTLAHLCELGDGTVIAPGALTPWMTNAVVESVIFDTPSTVISVSHKRTFTGALRRAIQVRDRRCQHASGCDVPADRCDIDHVVPRSHGGQTAQWNGRALCDRHNRHPELRDDPEPAPPREMTVLDELRARIRWRVLHGLPDDDAA